MTEKEALYKLCLHLGDNALIQSYRLSEWCSNAPLLEEDLALTNFALDMIGRAQALLSYAAEIEGKGRTDDDLAYRRGEREFYNDLLTELPNTDFAHTMARQLFMSAWEYYFYDALRSSSDATLSAIATKTLKEIKYHLAHATDWVIRLGDGTGESHKRMQAAIDNWWAYTGALTERDAADELLHENGIIPDSKLLYEKWKQHIDTVLKEAKLTVLADEYMQASGRSGIHTEHLGHILSEMQYLQRAYPDATW